MSKCCVNPFSRRSRSDKILKSLNLKTSNSDLDVTEVDLYRPKRRDVFGDKPERYPSEEILLERAQTKKDDSLIDTKFDPRNIKNFLDQDISKIRNKNRNFEDPYFIKYISSIVENTKSQLYLSLKSRLRCNNLKELNKAIKWERTQVHIFSSIFFPSFKN